MEVYMSHYRYCMLPHELEELAILRSCMLDFLLSLCKSDYVSDYNSNNLRILLAELERDKFAFCTRTLLSPGHLHSTLSTNFSTSSPSCFMKALLADFKPYMLFSNLKTLFAYSPASAAGACTILHLPISRHKRPLTIVSVYHPLGIAP
jgi:hypothetical protein